MTAPAAAAVIAPLRPGEVEAVAAMHRACLPQSILTALGPDAVARYYRYLATSGTETVWVARVGGELAAACVLSRAPASIMGRFARHATVRIVVEAAWALRASRDLRRRCARRVFERAAGGDDHEIPEVTQIFTAAHHRGRGLGRELLGACERALRAAAEPAYLVHTHRDDNAAGLRFYQREGFASVGETRSFGDWYLVMQKGLR